MFLARNFSQLDAKVESDAIENVQNIYVVQEYIHPPHLLHGKHKYHLRLYMVISSLDPLTIHLYRDALVLVAPDEYSADVAYDNDMAKHLSNSNVRLKFEKEKSLATPRFTLAEIFSVMRGDGVNATAVWEEIRQMSAKTVLNLRASGTHVFKTHACTRSGVDPKLCSDIDDWTTLTNHLNHSGAKGHIENDLRLQRHCCKHANAEASLGGTGHYTGPKCFDFWGIDVMFNSAWKPFLLEVNLGPNLFYYDYHQQLVATQALDDLFEMVMPDGDQQTLAAMASFERMLAEFQLQRNISHCEKMSFSYKMLANYTCGNCDLSPNSWGPSGERWQNASRTNVVNCKKTCDAHVNCGSFNFVESHQRCYFRANDGTCEQNMDLDRDCYIKTDRWENLLRNLQGRVDCLSEKDILDLWHLHKHVVREDQRMQTSPKTSRGFEMIFPTLGMSLKKLKPFFTGRTEKTTGENEDLNVNEAGTGRSNDLAISWQAFMRTKSNMKK